MTRRTFLAALSAAPLLGQTRRTVSVGGRRVRVVDIHGHFVAPEELPLVQGTPLASNITANLNGQLVLGEARLRAMDERGVDIQALSHQGGWWYSTDRDLAARLVRVQNEKLAGWCAAHADRFVGLASVALQYPDLAAEQLQTAVRSMNLRGVGIAGVINGETPSTEKFDPFWSKVQELGALVFVHPTGVAGNTVQTALLGARGDLGNIIGNPLETTVFLSRMILDGVFDRFPNLRVCGAHAGGYLPSYLGRTDVACTVRPNANCANKKPPREYFKQQILVDSMIFSEEGLRHLVAELGVSQIVFGTDMPYNWPSNVDLILNAPFLSNPEKEAILSGNLLRLLRV
jgi:aminocarboxymuconate-semialdehyde decarboxylase